MDILYTILFEKLVERELEKRKNLKQKDIASNCLRFLLDVFNCVGVEIIVCRTSAR